MRHILAVLLLGATLTLAASAAFADQWVNGYDVSTYQGCQAANMYWHMQNIRDR